MASKSILFNYSIKNIPDYLPKRFQDTNLLYTGHYTSINGYSTAYKQRSGQFKGSFGTTVAALKAVSRALMIAVGSNKDAFGLSKDGKYGIAEVTDSDDFIPGKDIGIGKSVTVMYVIDKGNFLITDEHGGMPDFTKNPMPLHMAIIPVALRDPVFEVKFYECVDALKNDPNYPNDTALSDDTNDLLVSNALWMSDFIYTRVTEGSFKCCDASGVKMLNPSVIARTKLDGHTVVGSPAIFACDSIPATPKTVSAKKEEKTVDELKGKYSFGNENLTPELQQRVAVLSENTIISDDDLELCRQIKESSIMPTPLRNILFRGEPGVGKTFKGGIISAVCNKPLYIRALNPMTEVGDIYGMFMPIDDEGNQTGNPVSLEEAIKNMLADMPSLADIQRDPAAAYKNITGVENTSASIDECIAAMFRIANSSIGDGRQKYKFVEGPMVKAMREGGIFRCDEINLPMNPGVLVALNPAMDGVGQITLPNGEVVKRHPDCIFVFTMNVDLEGCRPLNQAFIDRCQRIVDVQPLNDIVLKERIKAMVGWNDDTYSQVVDLDKYITAYHALKEVARKKRATDGNIGPRKLAEWVCATVLMGGGFDAPIKAARQTIIAGATADEDKQGELMQKLSDFF